MDTTSKRNASFLLFVFALTAASLACRSNARPAATETAAATMTVTPTAENTATPVVIVVTATPEPATPEPPTAIPPANTADISAPTILETHPSHSLVYYGLQRCGVTRISVEAEVTDDVQVQAVWVQYRFNGSAGLGTVGPWKTKFLVNAGGTDKYGETVDLQFEPIPALNKGNGVLQYQIMARDTAGNETTYPNGSLLDVAVEVCK